MSHSCDQRSAGSAAVSGSSAVSAGPHVSPGADLAESGSRVKGAGCAGAVPGLRAAPPAPSSAGSIS
jgi:hypothetical protein